MRSPDVYIELYFIQVVCNILLYVICCKDDKPVSRHRSDSGTHTASSSLSGSTHADTSQESTFQPCLHPGSSPHPVVLNCGTSVAVATLQTTDVLVHSLSSSEKNEDEAGPTLCASLNLSKSSLTSHSFINSVSMYFIIFLFNQ